VVALPLQDTTILLNVIPRYSCSHILTRYNTLHRYNVLFFSNVWFEVLNSKAFTSNEYIIQSLGCAIIRIVETNKISISLQGKRAETKETMQNLKLVQN
jgi:hypothetical protein